MTNAELIKALREVANWIVAMSYNSEYAHDELKMLHYEDSIRAAADALEAANKRIAELEAQLPKRGEWIIKPHGTYGQLRAFCSACEKHSGIGGIVSNQKKPYCPNCGAIMDGKEIVYG